MHVGIKMINRTWDSFSSLCQKMGKVFYLIGGEMGTFILFLFYTNLFPVPPGRAGLGIRMRAGYSNHSTPFFLLSLLCNNGVGTNGTISMDLM